MILSARRAIARARFTRTAAVLSLAASCASCDDASQQSTANTAATTAPATTSTTGDPATSSAAASTTATTTGATTTSAATTTTTAASSTASASSASGTGGTSSSTATTTGIGGSAGDNSDSSSATSDGTTDSTTTGGTTAGVVVLEDVCSHEPCGGALPNTAWRHVRACVPKEQIIGPMLDFCPSITLLSSGGELAGTISFTDDSFNQEVSFSLWIELDVPIDCDISCPMFAASLALLGFPGATCEESNDSCHCIGAAQGTDPRSGDFIAADDGTLTLLGLGDIEASYCVADNSFSYLIPVMLVPQGTPMDVVYETVPQ